MNRILAIPLAIAIATTPAAAADVTIQAQGPVIELAVSETVKARPDTATVAAGVTTRAQTASAAMTQNAAAMDAVVKRVRALGIAPDDIQTQGIGLNAQYDYDQAQSRQIFRGYQASNRVSVVLRKVGDTGRVLDALVAAGANDISGPEFSIFDDTAPRAQARKGALDKARRQAEEYARWAGYSGVRLLEISEEVRGGRPMPYAGREIALTSADIRTPVEPGLVSTSVQVAVTYEMTR